jgi:hypothetical protein
MLYESFFNAAWGQRALGPGSVETGLLFFDWDEAEEFQDGLTLTIDLRDLVNDWHTVIPVPVKVARDAQGRYY